MVRARYITSAFLVALLVGCDRQTPPAPPAAPTTPPPPPSGPAPAAATVSGLVFESTPAGRRGIGNTRIDVWIQSGNTGRFGGTLISDAGGRYQIGSVNSGDLVVVRSYNADWSQPCAATVTAGLGAVLDIELVPPRGKPAVTGPPTLSGVLYELVDGQRRPIADGWVTYDWQCDDGMTEASSRTDAEGRFAMCRLPMYPTVCVYAHDFGRFRSVAVPSTGGDMTLDIDIATPAPPPNANIDGVYTLRVESTCTAIPEALRSRTYTATITDSPTPVVRLSGAEFWTPPGGSTRNTFTGHVSQQSVSFTVDQESGTERWGIVERVDATTLLEIAGVGSGVVDGASINVSMFAGIGAGQDLRDDARHAGCGPGQHQLAFTFRRQ